MFIVYLLIRIRAVKLHMIMNAVQTWHTITQLNQSKVWPRSAVLKAREFAYIRNQWSVSSHDGAMARYTVNTLLTSLIGLKERCVFCGEKPNKYIWQDIPQSMRPLQVPPLLKFLTSWFEIWNIPWGIRVECKIALFYQTCYVKCK